MASKRRRKAEAKKLQSNLQYLRAKLATIEHERKYSFSLKLLAQWTKVITVTQRAYLSLKIEDDDVFCVCANWVGDDGRPRWAKNSYQKKYEDSFLDENHDTLFAKTSYDISMMRKEPVIDILRKSEADAP